MVGMGVVKTNDVFAALAAFALNPHQLLGIDVVAVVGGIGASIAAAGNRGHYSATIVLDAAQQDATALVGIGLFAVLTKGIVVVTGQFQHRFRMQKPRGRMQK
jgi:hypothetical protein